MNVLIIEDDPMVEFIHRNYLEKMAFFTHIFSSGTLLDAEETIKNRHIDLVLLDIHLKDGSGLTFLSNLRKNRDAVEVIVITAANEGGIVREVLHLGALDYLIKPFTFERFKQSIQLFKKKRQQLETQEIKQAAIDEVIYLTGEDLPTKTVETPLEEKGLSTETYHIILTVLTELKQPFSVQDVVKISGLSHVSVRKYLAYLEAQGRILSNNVYLKVGRPYKVYTLKK